MKKCYVNLDRASLNVTLWHLKTGPQVGIEN